MGKMCVDGTSCGGQKQAAYAPPDEKPQWCSVCARNHPGAVDVKNNKDGRPMPAGGQAPRRPSAAAKRAAPAAGDKGGAKPADKPADRAGAKPPLKKKRHLNYDLPDMMFGFGDVEAPLQSTVDTVEDLVASYVTTLVKKAQESKAGQQGKAAQLTEQDLLMQVRKDPPKYYRATELLTKWDEIKTAKANNLEVDGTTI